jgi:tetratricopeptide (TPR) repeat protein
MQVSGTLVSASATEIETPPSKPQNTDEPPPLANVIEACAYGHLHLPLGPLLGQGEDLQQSLTLAQYPYERAALWLQMGFSYSLRGRDPWKGFRTCQKAYLIAKDLGDIPLQTFALTYSYFSLGIVREFAQAAELWQEADKTIATFPHSELKTIHLMYSAKYMFQRGDTSISDRYLNEALGEIHNHGLLYLYPWSFMDLTFQKF